MITVEKQKRAEDNDRKPSRLRRGAKHIARAFATLVKGVIPYINITFKLVIESLVCTTLAAQSMLVFKRAIPQERSG